MHTHVSVDAATPQTKPKWLLLKTVVCLVGAGMLTYLLWSPGVDVRDGRHDLGRNGIWMAHGWLGDDAWFLENHKTNQIPLYRDSENIRGKAESLRHHHITDVFPHLCPTLPTGHLPQVNSNQVERFLDLFHGFRVLPWVGGANGGTAHPSKPRWHPYPEVHWDESYFRSVAQRVDQMAVMMYDAGQRIPKTYTHLMADWTEQVLDWSGNTSVLLGVPTYSDGGVEYHHPFVENLDRALPGIHRGLSRRPALPRNYQGVAIYCDWETSPEEWDHFQSRFLKHDSP